MKKKWTWRWDFINRICWLFSEVHSFSFHTGAPSCFGYTKTPFLKYFFFLFWLSFNSQHTQYLFCCFRLLLLGQQETTGWITKVTSRTESQKSQIIYYLCYFDAGNGRYSLKIWRRLLAAIAVDCGGAYYRRLGNCHRFDTFTFVSHFDANDAAKRQK